MEFNYIFVLNKNKIFYMQRKYRNPDKADPNWIIRNLEGGFLYEHGNVKPPKDVLDQSIRAFKASSLDFGAIDVIWNEKKSKAYVLEVNTEDLTCNCVINLPP